MTESIDKTEEKLLNELEKEISLVKEEIKVKIAIEPIKPQKQEILLEEINNEEQADEIKPEESPKEEL